MKIERLIEIIMLLLENDRISANKLAQHFKVSKRTIQRDMNTLNLAHIPIYTTYGPTGGYGIMDSYKFDKRLLTVTDLRNILVSLSGLNELLVDEQTQKTFEKIKGLLPVSIDQSKLNINFQQNKFHPELTSIRQSLYTAIQNLNILELSYIDRTGNQTSRQVAPKQLQYRDTGWYLIALSLDKNAYRTFKLSRIINITILDDHFSEQTLPHYSNQMALDNSLTTVELEVLIAKSSRDKILEGIRFKCLFDYDEQYYQGILSLPHHEFGYRYIAAFGSSIKIIKPQSFIDDYTKWLQNIIHLNQP